MSIKAMAAVWEMNIKPADKLVLLAYADHADHSGGSIYPAVSTIAAKTGFDERSVRRITARLKKDGYLVASGVTVKGTNRYCIPLTVSQPPLTVCPPTPDSGSANPSITVNEPKRAADAAPVVVGTTQQPTIMATEIVNSTAMEPKHDAVTDFFERAVKAKTHKDIITAWKGQQHLKDVCITLCDVTGLQVTKGDAGKWLKGAVALYELGATDEILRRVWDEATARDRQFMTHPQAFVERVRSVLATQVSTPANTGAALVEWVTTPAGKILRYDGVPYPGESGRQKCVELGIAYEGGN